jgi:hypothetical protein
MKTTIECIVYICMMIALYINWTDVPKVHYFTSTVTEELK